MTRIPTYIKVTCQHCGTYGRHTSSKRKTNLAAVFYRCKTCESEILLDLNPE